MVDVATMHFEQPDVIFVVRWDTPHSTGEWIFRNASHQFSEIIVEIFFKKRKFLQQRSTSNLLM
jgi:hypothetical protein